MKFPRCTTKHLSEMTPEQEMENGLQWGEAFAHYVVKYPQQFEKVKAKFAEAHAPDEPKPNEKPESAVMLSTAEANEIRALLATKKQVRRKFMGDKHFTTFKIVEGVVKAFEPKWPEGRKMYTEEEMRSGNDGGLKPRSDRGVLRWFYDEWKSEEGIIIYSLHQKIEDSLPEHMELTKHAKVIMCCMACLIARENHIGLRPIKEGLLVGINKDIDQELLRDVLTMITCV